MITKKEFCEATGLHPSEVDLVEKAYQDFLAQDLPFWEWWAENQAHYV